MTDGEHAKIQLCVVGVAGIVLLETMAIYKGLDGQLFGTAIGAIAIIVGYAFGVTRTKSK